MKWRHKKQGTIYEVIHPAARMQCSYWEYDNKNMVVYRREDGVVWVRPAKEFYDGRFVEAVSDAEQA